MLLGGWGHEEVLRVLRCARRRCGGVRVDRGDSRRHRRRRCVVCPGGGGGGGTEAWLAGRAGRVPDRRWAGRGNGATDQWAETGAAGETRRARRRRRPQSAAPATVAF